MGGRSLWSGWETRRSHSKNNAGWYSRWLTRSRVELTCTEWVSDEATVSSCDNGSEVKWRRSTRRVWTDWPWNNGTHPKCVLYALSESGYVSSPSLLETSPAGDSDRVERWGPSDVFYYIVTVFYLECGPLSTCKAALLIANFTN